MNHKMSTLVGLYIVCAYVIAGNSSFAEVDASSRSQTQTQAPLLPASAPTTVQPPQNQSSNLSLAPLQVTASQLPLRDETTNSILSTAIKNPPGTADLAPALERLSGVTVRNSSGPGSLLRAFPAYGLNAGQGQFSIGAIPVINPLGTGANLSLVPVGQISQVQIQSPFSANLLFDADPRPAPAGRLRIDLNQAASALASSRASSLGEGYKQHEHIPVSARVLLHSPRGARFDGSMAWRGLTAGASAMTTDGRYRYRDVVTKQTERRIHNDASSGALLIGHSHENERWQLKSAAMLSRIERTVPGSLAFPRRDHERDDFLFTGLEGRYNTANSYQKPKPIDFRASFTRTATAFTSDADSLVPRTDDRALTAYGLVGITPVQSAHLQSNITLDHENTRLRTDNGRFYRGVSGFTWRNVITPWGKVPLTIAPLFRQELSNQYSGARNYRIATTWQPRANWQIAAGFAYDHVYPSITALTGYQSPYGLVRGNAALGVERHRQFHGSVGYETQSYRSHLLVFQNHVSSMAGFSFSQDGSSQFVAAPRARVQGITYDQIQNLLSGLISWRGALTLQRAVDLTTLLDAPYKPRVQILASLGIRPTNKALITAEQTYQSSRRYSATEPANRGDARLPAWWATHLRFEYRWHPSWLVVARVSNLFDRALEDYPGYPAPGRTYSLSLDLSI